MRDKLANAMKEAMKAKDNRRLSTIRLIMAAIKDRDIATRAPGQERVSDEEILLILAKMIKQREESSKTYEEAGRTDLAQQEREEMAVIREFMPAQMSEEKMKEACGKVVSETGSAGLRDMGKCMNALKERYPGQMDFAKASGIVKEILK
ncbi:GatB/YqeY domain-containing protein [Rhizobium sp. L1K21]|uniref:GatB/YqeY domain-containing protein n=1 Tax=Rhizobium sp. L1K21 TaxID=2954933 RepID=UPI00209214BC|nr:GatB/YqeY domain-containing protein [Rhizobium sp. L1K21]MCO6185519.1 GatB/YqeY domain-containing protein [Rhizobium sp. L1K21]